MEVALEDMTRGFNPFEVAFQAVELSALEVELEIPGRSRDTGLEITAFAPLDLSEAIPFLAVDPSESGREHARFFVVEPDSAPVPLVIAAAEASESIALGDDDLFDIHELEIEVIYGAIAEAATGDGIGIDEVLAESWFGQPDDTYGDPDAARERLVIPLLLALGIAFAVAAGLTGAVL